MSTESIVVAAVRWIKTAAFTGDEDFAVEEFLAEVERLDREEYRANQGARIKARRKEVGQ